MIPLKDRWRAFLAIILDPLSIGLLLSTLAMSILLILQTDRVVIATFTFLVAVFSGILGGVLGKKWDDLTGERVIVARGYSAIRSLKLLLGNAVALERRVSQYLGQCTEKNEIQGQLLETVATYLEEVIDRCRLLEEGILSSIESWTDIIPEAAVKTQIGVISDLNAKVDDLIKEIQSLSSDAQETKGKSEEEIEKLKAEKKEKEKELAELRRELSARTIDMGFSLGPGAVRSGSGSLLSAESQFSMVSPIQICSSCGRKYKISPGVMSITTLCPTCSGLPRSPKAS